MKTFKEYNDELLTESPDYLDDLNIQFNDPRFKPRTFFIINGTIIYSTDHMVTHTSILRYLIFSSAVNPNPKVILEELKSKFSVTVLNHKKGFFDHRKIVALEKAYQRGKHGITARPPTGIISGRFWATRRGYISFWEDEVHVLKQLPAVRELIFHMQFHPESVRWETYNEEKLVSYNEYVTGKPPSKKDLEQARLDRAFQIAMHTQAGLRKAAGQNKAWGSSLEDAEEKELMAGNE